MANKNAIIIAVVAALGLIFGVVIGAQLRPKPAASPRPIVVAPTPTTTVPALLPTATVAVPQAAPTPKIVKASPPPAPAEPPRPELSSDAPVVCVDPGHPSETSDGASAHGLSENTLNWEVAVKLRDRLEAMGIRCVLTKDSRNQHRTNRERAEIANSAGAAVFVRLHCDIGGGHGYTWYYPDREGHKAGINGPPKSVQESSHRAASVINQTMETVLDGHLQNNPILTDASTFVGGKQGGVLTGSIFALVPTALIEMCYINQKKDAQFIASQEGQDLMAEALAKGIYAFVRR